MAGTCYANGSNHQLPVVRTFAESAVSESCLVFICPLSACRSESFAYTEQLKIMLIHGRLGYTHNSSYLEEGERSNTTQSADETVIAL